MKYTHAKLIQAVGLGRQIQYLFFWGHKPAPDGQLTATCLSQWWMGNPFSENGHTYLTAEHYMMAGKARLFQDKEMFFQILSSTTPGAAKALGRKVRNFDQATWEAYRTGIVTQGNYLKFSQHAALKAFLLATWGRVLVEASPMDRIWGIGLGKEHPDAQHPSQWQGGNLLGFCLMEARDRILAEEGK
ncbi:MAG: NADAR family protein [Bacteroidota bacterium]